MSRQRPPIIAQTLALLVTWCLSSCGGCGEPSPTDPSQLPEQYRKPGEDGYVMVIDGYTSDQGLRLIGAAWNDVWVRGCRITDAQGDGIFIRDVERVKISGCEISGVKGQGGIRLSATGGSKDVLLLENHIHDVAENGINASQRSDDDVHHDGLVVRGNLVERTGLEADSGLTHGLYIQSRDALIEGNTVRQSNDGNGISVRSTSHVRHNVVQGWAKSAIRYYSDHDRGQGPILIEGNMIHGAGSGAAIELRFAPEAPERFVARRAIVRFNTVASTSQSAAIGVDPQVRQRASVRVEGNLVRGAIEGVEGAGALNATLEPSVVRSLEDPVDLHLSAPHPQRGAFDGLEAPAQDIDADPVPGTGRDPGADQVP